MSFLLPPSPNYSLPAVLSSSEGETLLDQPRQSGCVKKPSRIIESQPRREVEEKEMKEKRPKISKFKFQIAP